MRVISHRYSGEAQKQCHSVSVSTPTYPVRWLTEDISGMSVGARKRGKVQGQPEGAPQGRVGQREGRIRS